MKAFMGVSAAVAFAVLASCRGPAGPTGPQGVQGAQGGQGPQGPTGNANIISGADTATDADWSSQSIQFLFDEGGGASAGGKPARYLDIAVPQLTGATYSSGAALVWMQAATTLNFSDTVFVQLPWDFLFLSGSDEYHYVPTLVPGDIRVMFLIQDLTNPANYPSPLGVTQATRIFRWVVIPPAAASIVPSLHPEDGPAATIAALRAHGFRVESSGGR